MLNLDFLFFFCGLVVVGEHTHREGFSELEV